MSAFPQAILDTRVELLLGGVWTNVTSYVYERDSVSVTRGHPDEASQANPSAAPLTLTDQDGRFSPYNPTGPYYGQIGRNTPLRISVPEGSTYLRLEGTADYASCPDRVSFGITGDIDIRVDLRLDNYALMTLVTKWASATDRAWALRLNANGTPVFEFVDNTATDHAATCDASIPLGRVAIRATLQVNNGSGGRTTTFYTAPTLAGPWTQLGDPVINNSGTITLATSTAPLSVGYGYGYIVTDPVHTNHVGPTGKVYSAQVLSGIGGTTVASPVFTAQSAGTTPFADAQGNTWSVTGTAEISDRKYRFHGEVPAWPPRRDTSNKDVYTPIHPSGVLRRLTQGTPPVLSAMYRAYVRLTGSLAPVAYWPCEDGANSTSIGAAIGSTPMTVAGTPTFGSNSSFTCSKPIPALGGSTWTGSVSTSATWTDNVLRFLMQVPAGGEADGTVLVSIFTTGTVARADLIYRTGAGLQIKGYSGAGATLYDSGAVTGAPTNGLTLRVSMDLRASGPNIQAEFGTLLPGATNATVYGQTVSSASVGAVTRVVINPNGGLTSTAIGHISVQSLNDSLGDLLQPLNAWSGEAAGTRFARLCSEEGVASRIYGFPTDTALMGPQLATDFVSLLQQIEDADRGLLYEPRQCLGLAYRTRVSMLNQAAAVTLSFSAAQLSEPLEPVDDDQLTVNDVTVPRQGGSSARAVLASGTMSTQPPPNGIGLYDSAVPAISLASDGQLADEAGWLLHLGTVNELRYPHIAVNLARSELAALYYQLQDVDIGDRIAITGFPADLPPDGASQIVRGMTEVCYGYVFTIEWACVPESPYRVVALDDAVLGRVDTDGSTVHTGIGSGAASMQVDTVANVPLWTTSAGDFPLDIMVGGERMTVTNITGASSPQTFTITRSVNGVVKAQTAGTDVRLFQPPILSL